MLNKRNRYSKRTVSNKFKRYSDVNKFNDFLLSLDNNNQNQNQNISHTINKDVNIKEIIKNIEQKYNNLNFNDSNYHGIKEMDLILKTIENSFNPNLYNPITTNFENTKHKTKNKNKINIVTEINNINDLIHLIDTYPDIINTEYNINMESLHKIKEPLKQLNSMIGMKKLKENIVDQVIFYIQNLHSFKHGNDFMHTVIYGPPGTGKTEIAKIIGSIFSNMGVLKKGTFRKVTRSDLIAGYLGQTALKTKDVINDCLGGVLFIDEAYALGNEEKRDIFSKECIDTLCEALSDHKDNLMVIIAGYETDLNNCFFNYNQGLNSRFTWRFKTDEYTAEELYNIFIKKVKESEWFILDNELTKIEVKWFEKNKLHFKFFGRDIETLFAKSKIAHSRRVFCLDPSVKKYLSVVDLDKGLEMYINNGDSKSKNDQKFQKILTSMYV